MAIMNVILLLVTVLSLTVVTIVLALRRRVQYWERKKVPYKQPIPVLGNFAEYILLKKYVGQLTQNLCQNFRNEPYFGAFYGTEPTLIIQDPDLIKLVMTKDFYYFSGREISRYSHREKLMQNLFFSYGDKWKVLRQNLTPIFSSAKMKQMFYLIENCSHVFEKMLDKETINSKVIEVRALMARFTMDCVGSCTFGIETNTMEKIDGNPFRSIGDVIFDTHKLRAFKNVARTIWPAIFYGLGFQSFPKEIETFFHQLLTGIFEGRQYKPTARNDFVDLVLKLKNINSITGDSLSNMKTNLGKKVNLEISDDLLVSQCFVFFAAGYETSATTLSFLMYELAKTPDAQKKVLEEVDSYLRRHDNVLKYESVAEMPYLQACIDEALRLYPVLGVLTREVVEEYILPNGLKLDKGLRVHLPVYHLHYNPEYFDDPEKFRPERFFGEEKCNVKPYTYLPFGEGPRVCIGMRFAKMQMTAGLITLLKKYRLELAPDMKSHVEFEPKAIVTQPIGGIRLKFTVREGWEQRLLKSSRNF